MFLYTDDMILYIENLKDFTKKLWELINELNKVARYRITIQKSVVSLYTNNKISKKIWKQFHSQYHQNN